MTGFGRVVGASFFTLLAILASMMMFRDGFVQMFAVWVILEWILRHWFYGVVPNSLKTLGIAAAVVLLMRAFQSIPEQRRERFVVNWDDNDAVHASNNCTDTVTESLWSDPDKIIDKRVDFVLQQTKDMSREIEEWLHVNWPNQRGLSSDQVTIV